MNIPSIESLLAELDKYKRAYESCDAQILSLKEQRNRLKDNIAELQSSHDALEAKLAKYEKLEPACWMTPDGEGWRMRTKPPENDVPLGWMPLYALEMK